MALIPIGARTTRCRRALRSLFSRNVSYQWPLLLTLGPDGGMRFAFPPYGAARVSVKGGWSHTKSPKE